MMLKMVIIKSLDLLNAAKLIGTKEILWFTSAPPRVSRSSQHDDV